MLERTGQTEAAVDLARLAGLTPAGVICEVMNDDGTMARVDDLTEYCRTHDLKMITIADLIAYRRLHDKLVERVVETRLPDRLRRVQRGGLPLAGRREAPRGDGQGRGRGRGRRARARALRVPHRRRVPLAALRLRPAARGRAAADREGGHGACCSTSPRRVAGSACSTSSGPTSSRRRASTPSTRTSSWACRPTCATTASAPRSWWTSASRRSGCSPTTPRRSWASRATAWRVTDQVPIEHAPGDHNADYLRAKAQKLGHLLHHQGLALDEEMIAGGADPRPRARRASRAARAGPRGRAAPVADYVRDRRRPLLRGSGRPARRGRDADVRGGGRERRGARRARRLRAARWPRSTAPSRGATRASPAWAR